MFTCKEIGLEGNIYLFGTMGAFAQEHQIKHLVPEQWS